MEDEPMVQTYPFKRALISTLPDFRTITSQILSGTEKASDGTTVTPVISMTPMNVEDLIMHLQKALAEYHEKQMERGLPSGPTN